MVRSTLIISPDPLATLLVWSKMGLVFAALLVVWGMGRVNLIAACDVHK